MPQFLEAFVKYIKVCKLFIVMPKTTTLNLKVNF